MEVLKPPGQFAFDASNLAEAWRRWEGQFNTYYEACELEKKPGKVQVAILLHAAGPEAQEIHSQFRYDATVGESKEDYEQVLRKFRNYCAPKKNTVFERYRYWSRDQMESENVDSWVKDLRIRAVSCEFKEQEDLMIRDKLVFGVKDSRVKERLLRVSDLTMERAIDIIRAAESTKLQLREMAGESASKSVDVHAFKSRGDRAGSSTRGGLSNRRQGQETRAVSGSDNQGERQANPRQPRNGSTDRSNDFAKMYDCTKCGHRHKARNCPAFGQKCHVCQGNHHFAIFHDRYNQDNSKKMHMVTEEQEDSSTDNEDIFFGAVDVLNLDSAVLKKHDWVSEVRVGETDVEFKLDTGAQGNILPVSVYRNIIPAVSLKPTNVILAGFSRDMRVKPLGVVEYMCKSKETKIKLKFYVIEEGDQPLMGRESCVSLGLLKLVKTVVQGGQSGPQHAQLSWENIRDELYPDNFKGDGELGPEYDIQLNPNVEGTVQYPHKIPYAKLKPLKTTLHKLQERGIIADTEGPTQWVSNLVITNKKNGTIRLCLDPKPLNKAILREHFIIPTPDEIAAKLAGKKVFSVLDLKDAFWHIKLSEKSSYFTTFHTPWGRKRFLRMPFGISSASEVLAKRVHDNFADIEGAHCIFDDMIIAGDDDDDHDEIMINVMERARDRNVKFNGPKTQFKIPKVKYVGNFVSGDGLTPDPEKINAITNMPLPTDKQSLMRLLGMVKYLSKFIPKESSITAPLRMLLKEDAAWDWQPEHTQALEDIKTALTSEPVLRFYDVTKQVTIQADASQSGLGACLLQGGQPVAYASRSLTSAEENYAQLEKELLAICFACSKFHQYVYGKETEVQTDHKPLVIIVKKPIAKASPRVQRMMLRLQRYELNLTYVPGKEMYLADTLSRAYIQGEPDNELGEDIEVMVHTVISDVPASESKMEEIRAATNDDITLQRLKKVVLQGWPESNKSVKEISDYWSVRDEISVCDNLLFVGTRVVIPESMRSDMLRLIHEGHMGAEKCKVRARAVMFWPGLSRDIDNVVSRCSVCLQFRSANAKEPLLPHTVPEGPYQKVAMDILTFKGVEFLLIVDYYSKYPELCRLGQQKNASVVISHVKSVFARHGIPEEVIADNMPFNSVKFRSFAEEWGFKITTSSPRYPQSNGQAERMVGVVKRMLKKAEVDGSDPYIALLQYRTTPVCGLPYSPAQMLMSRQLRTKLPVTANTLKPAVVDARPFLQSRQALYKSQFDKSSRQLPPLREGDTVRFRQHDTRTWQPAVVKQCAETPRSYIIQHELGELRRNRRHLMRSQEPPPLLGPPPDDQLVECKPYKSDSDISPQTESPRPPPPESPPMRSPPPSPMPSTWASSPPTRPRRNIKPPERYKDYMRY